MTTSRVVQQRVATGTLFAAINVTGVPLIEQRMAALGAGSAAASPA